MGLKYIILRDSYINDLVISVNKHISEDWYPIGGIAFNDSVGMQAMIKTECDHKYDMNSSSLNCIKCGKPKNHIDNTSTKD